MTITDRRFLSVLGIVVSVVLLALKLWAGAVSGSIAVISDALNSFLDIFSYTIIAVSVSVQHKRPDATHPYGHYRAEPLAGFIVAVVATMLGFSVVKDAVQGLAGPSELRFSGIPLIVLGISIAVKIGVSILYTTANRRLRSAAFAAAAVDSRNDVLASATALLGFALKGVWDAAAGVAIGVWILYSGIRMGIDNSGYLLGKSPGEPLITRARRAALSISGVSGVNDIRAHFVGSFIHLELHIEVPPEMAVSQAHGIGEDVRVALEGLEDVGAAFVHIDVLGDTYRLPL